MKTKLIAARLNRRQKDAGGWKALERQSGVNAGTLKYVAEGKRQPSARLIARLIDAGLLPDRARTATARRQAATVVRRDRRQRQVVARTNRRVSRARDLFAIPTKVLAKLIEGRSPARSLPASDNGS